MAYTRARSNWQDWPSTATLIRASDLNTIDQAAFDLKYLTYNVKDYGAVGDGVVDDTTAINNAWTDCLAANGVLYFPRGTFLYTGTGLNGTQIRVRGEGPLTTSVTLGASSRFINVTTALSNLNVSGIHFNNGVDVIKSTFTGVNVINYAIVENCEFVGYTGAAITNNASDFPYWKIKNCQFIGANYTSCMGIALSGLSDVCSITDCDFERNRIHIKLRKGGNNAYIRNNAFLRLGATGGSPRVDVWIVPDPAITNAGDGFVCDSNKFGNENLDSADYRILFADEDTGAGSDNGTYFPKLTADSTGYVFGHRYSNNAFFGLAGNIPMIFSTTPNVQGIYFGSALLGTEPFPYVLQFRTAPTADRNNLENIFGPFHGSQLGTENTLPPPLSNGKGMGFAVDPNSIIDARVGTPISRSGAADPVDYAKLLPTLVRSFSLVNATLANVADVYGGIDATEITFTTSAGICYGQLTMGNIRVGDPIWIEFDVKQGSSSALTIVRVDLETESGAMHFRRTIDASSSTWRRIRLLMPGTRTAAGQTDVVFSTNGTETGKVQIGRVKVYHAREPISVDGVMLRAATGYKALTYSASITPDASLGNNQAIVATNGTAFTINAPTSPILGQTLTLDIKNSSGGAMGAITWNAAFLLAGAFVNPANGKRRTISFYYDNTNWVETNRAAADI